MGPALDHEERPERPERQSATAGLPLEYRGIFALQRQAAGFAEQQYVLAFATVGAADQDDVALARHDPGLCSPYCFDAGRLAEKGP